jgi:hypothetical protein
MAGRATGRPRFRIQLMGSDGQVRREWTVDRTMPAPSPAPDAEVDAEAERRKALLDLLAHHAGEAMNSYRYFGTLRALVSWLPAIMVLTMIGYALRLPGVVSAPALYAAAGALAVVSLLIFLVQRHLQRLQYAWRITAERADELYVEALGGRAVAPVRLHELQRTVAGEIDKGTCTIGGTQRRFRWDFASWALAVFLTLLVVAHLGAAAYPDLAQLWAELRLVVTHLWATLFPG